MFKRICISFFICICIRFICSLLASWLSLRAEHLQVIASFPQSHWFSCGKPGIRALFIPKIFYLGCEREVGICWLFVVSVAFYSEFFVCWKLGIFTSVDFVSLWCFPFLSAFHYCIVGHWRKSGQWSLVWQFWQICGITSRWQSWFFTFRRIDFKGRVFAFSFFHSHWFSCGEAEASICFYSNSFLHWKSFSHFGDLIKQMPFPPKPCCQKDFLHKK